MLNLFHFIYFGEFFSFYFRNFQAFNLIYRNSSFCHIVYFLFTHFGFPFPFVLLSLARFSFWYMNDFIIHKQEVNADPNSGIKTNVSSLAQTYTHMLANNWDIANVSLLCVCERFSVSNFNFFFSFLRLAEF